MNAARRPVIGWLAAPLLAAFMFVLPLPPATVEQVYSNDVYPVWQGWLTTVSNLAPFAWLDVFIVLAVALVGWRTARLVGVARSDGAIAAIWEAFRRTVRAASLVALVFLAFWGLNYRRVPLDQRVPPAAPTVKDLTAIVAKANALGARLRPSAPDYPAYADITRVLHEPMNGALAKLHRAPLQVEGRPKRSLLLTPFFTRAGVDGMVNPFALETILNPDLLPFERPYALAHEWAHLAGAADEAEASAVGWLACMTGPPELAYSAIIYLIVEAGNALPRPVWSDVSRTLDGGIRTDLTALAHRQERQNPHVQRTAFRVYDEYLRANRVDDGVASYSRSLSLILSPSLREALSAYPPPAAEK